MRLLWGHFQNSPCFLSFLLFVQHLFNIPASPKAELFPKRLPMKPWCPAEPIWYVNPEVKALARWLAAYLGQVPFQ